MNEIDSNSQLIVMLIVKLDVVSSRADLLHTFIPAGLLEEAEPPISVCDVD